MVRMIPLTRLMCADISALNDDALVCEATLIALEESGRVCINHDASINRGRYVGKSASSVNSFSREAALGCDRITVFV